MMRIGDSNITVNKNNIVIASNSIKIEGEINHPLPD